MNLEDIAKKAGVSRSTVSRVINGQEYVSERTRSHVMAVIEEEGFTPNPAARTLVTQRTRLLGVVIPYAVNVVFAADDPFYFTTLLQGISDASNNYDYATLLWLGQSDEDEERLYQRVIRNRMMDGLVIVTANVGAHFLEHLLRHNIPFVMAERPAVFRDQISYVSVDNVMAAQNAISYLISSGRRKIGTLAGKLNNVDGQDRLLGYRLALEAAGISYNENLVAGKDFTRESGCTGTRHLLAQGVDAIFAASDSVAVGALRAVNEAGMRVPDDVAIIGFDNLPTALQTRPQLTTVDHPIALKGSGSLSLLIDIIEGRATSPQQVLLPTRLVIRESSLVQEDRRRYIYRPR